MPVDPVVSEPSTALVVVPTSTSLIPSGAFRPGFPPVHMTCRIVSRMTGEMSALVSERPLHRRDRRRTMWHIRQIAMYVCHVALQIPICDIADAFGRDRTTVAYSLRIVEGRRDDNAYDGFVDAVERLVSVVFAVPEAASDEE